MKQNIGTLDRTLRIWLFEKTIIWPSPIHVYKRVSGGDLHKSSGLAFDLDSSGSCQSRYVMDETRLRDKRASASERPEECQLEEISGSVIILWYCWYTYLLRSPWRPIVDMKMYLEGECVAVFVCLCTMLQEWTITEGCFKFEKKRRKKIRWCGCVGLWDMFIQYDGDDFVKSASFGSLKINKSFTVTEGTLAQTPGSYRGALHAAVHSVCPQRLDFDEKSDELLFSTSWEKRKRKKRNRATAPTAVNRAPKVVWRLEHEMSQETAENTSSVFTRCTQRGTHGEGGVIRRLWWAHRQLEADFTRGEVLILSSALHSSQLACE